MLILAVMVTSVDQQIVIALSL